MVKLQAFPWYGGKVRHVQKINPHLPNTSRFVVVFGGSASVLLNRSPWGLEVLNDINNDVINFFEVLRDSPDELIDWLNNTPYHETAFERSKQRLETDSLSKLEKAGYFFVRTTMSYNAYDSNTFAYSTKEIRRDQSQHTARYRHKIDQLERIAERLRRVQFLSRDFREVIEKFDKNDTLCYCDPPYLPETRNETGNYEYEMSRTDHKDFLSLALDYPEKIAISSYENALYNDELLEKDWWLMRFEKQELAPSESGTEKREVLYTNYPIESKEYEVVSHA